MYKNIKQNPSAKRGERGSKHSLLRLLVAVSIITFATSMLAVSCGKTADPNTNNNNNANNSGGNNSGGDGDGGGGGGSGGDGACTGICPTGKLTLSADPGSAGNYVKVSGGNTVTINAAAWAADRAPIPGTTDAGRAFNFGRTSGHGIFLINYPYPAGSTLRANMILLSRGHVTKDTIAIAGTTCTGSETADNTAARPEGNLCKEYTANSVLLRFNSKVGTVFNNPDTTKARGILGCRHEVRSRPRPSPSGDVLMDSSILTESRDTDCAIVPINNGGTAAAAEIDDAWVADAASVKEVELYAISIDLSDKAITALSDAPGFNLAALTGAQNNASIKELLKKNPWADLKFKVRVVNAATFATLP